MTNDEFLKTLHQFQILNALMQDMDLAGFLDRISRGEGIVPFTDPPMAMLAEAADHLREVVGIICDCQQRVRMILDARCREFVNKERGERGE